MMCDHLQPYSLHLDIGPQGAVVWARGELDIAAVADLRAVLIEAGKSGQRVVLDLTDVDLLDGSALGAIIAARKEADGHVAILLRHPQRLVRRVLNITYLDQVFEIEN